jgi:hypothetical protein
MGGVIIELDPPWDATPEMLQKLTDNPLIGGYRIRIFPREVSSA